LEARGCDSAAQLWDLVEEEGEQWLAACQPPFWGRRGTRRPDLVEHFRATEYEVPALDGNRPKSAFQINGGGAVGTGSLRGMPALRRLRQAGFSVWPFDLPAFPMLIEIYPRALTGPVVKGNAEARREYLHRYPDLPAAITDVALESDDAFDALVSALVMAKHFDQFETLRRADGPRRQLEGQIWLPSSAISSATERTPVKPTAGARRTKTGVLVSNDFRDNVIIDRYDPMLSTMRGSKREAMRSENSEDILTWNCFRSLRQIDPSAWLPHLATRAFGESHPFVNVEANMDLWQSVPPPPGLRRSQGAEGPSEIDVVIESDDAVWFIEAKYKSDISVRTTNNAERNQIIRNIDTGSWYAGPRKFYFALLVLDPQYSQAGVRTINTYRDSFSEVRRLLPHRPDGLANLRSLGTLTWVDIVHALEGCVSNAERDDERTIAARAVAWLNKKGIVRASPT